MKIISQTEATQVICLNGFVCLKEISVTQKYARADPKSSKWYRDYILSDKCKGLRGKKAMKFRRCFRMPLETFRELCQLAHDENWFPGYGQFDCTGRPIEILMLGSLRYLGRGWTFDDLEEATDISEESQRVFFITL
jgi:hypothetical protein